MTILIIHVPKARVKLQKNGLEKPSGTEDAGSADSGLTSVRAIR
jgi:hypothetical protein